MILSSCRNLLLLRGTTLSSDPPLGNLPYALSLGTVTFLAALSFRGVNLPLREKALFLKEHSLNLPISFSLGEVVLYATFSQGTNSSFGEFVLPFSESFLSLENWLYYYALYYIPFIDFLLDGGSIQIAIYSFLNLSTQTRQYLGIHTFLGESFPTFLDSINALRSKLAVLIEATSGKGSSSIVIASFLEGT